MKKTVQFKKQIPFEGSLVSISLEKEIKEKKDNQIEGIFLLEGEKQENEPFNYNLPFKINVDKKYNIDKSIVNISDFTYKEENNNLIINIELTLDNIEETPKLIDELKEEINNKPDKINKQEERDNKQINQQTEENNYKTYKVHILRENETIEYIEEKYKIKKEQLEEYNDLTNIKLGDKIIVPNN